MVAQSTFFDCDLFYLSCFAGVLVHVATAGGVIPNRVWTDPVHAHIRARLKNLPENLKFNYKLSDGVEEIINSKAQRSREKGIVFDRETYLHDFIEYAKCGCFSFDRTNIHESTDRRYHLVAYPVFDRKYEEMIRYVLGWNFSVRRYEAKFEGFAKVSAKSIMLNGKFFCGDENSELKNRGFHRCLMCLAM